MSCRGCWQAACALVIVWGSCAYNFASAAPYLLVCSYYRGRVCRFDGQTGQFVDEFIPSGSGGLANAIAMALGPDGNVYVSNSSEDNVLRYDGVTGDFIDAFVPRASGGLNGPQGLAFGPGGDLYVAGYNNNDGVRRYDGISGAFIGVFTKPTGSLGTPIDLAFGPDGHLYVHNQLDRNILQFHGGTGELIQAIVPNTYDTGPIAFGPDDNLYMSARGGDCVVRYDGRTGARIDTFIPSGSGGLDQPFHLTFEGDYLYVVGCQANGVFQYDASSGAFVRKFAGMNYAVGILFIPEPTTLSLLALGGLAVIRRRRRPR